MAPPFDEDHGPFPVYQVLLEEHNALSPKAAISLPEIEALRPAAEERHKAVQDPDERPDA